MTTLHALYSAALRRRQFLQEQRARFESSGAEFLEDLARLDDLRRATIADLCGYLLQDLEDVNLFKLESQLRYPNLLTIKHAYDQKITGVVRARDELAGDPEIVHFEHHLSTLQDEIAELEEPHQRLKNDLALWTQSRWFGELAEDGFFEPGYDPGLFQKFLDWRAGSFWMDEVEPALGRSFSGIDELRDAFVKLRGEAESVAEAVRGLNAKLDALNTKKNKYDDLTRRPDQLHREMVGELGDAITRHLEAAPEELRLEIATNDPNLAAFMKKLTGVQKQLDYLRELKVVRVDAVTQQLDQQLRKLDRTVAKTERKIAKYGRSYRAPKDAVEKLRKLEREKWDKRVSSLDKVRGRVSHFDDYERGSLGSDFLWWMLITNGLRGDDLYEVRVFMSEHPGWTPPQPLDEIGTVDFAADALADEMVGDLDEASTSDAS